MATLSTAALTLADWAKRLDPNGKVPMIVELLSQTNEILDDMLWREGNLPAGNRTVQRTSLPSVSWRLINQGVSASKSTTVMIEDQCGTLEAWSEVDCKLAELSGNTKAFRLSEAEAFIEAMNQEVGQTLFYGNLGTTADPIAPEEFNGLATRYNAISGATNSSHVISGSGSGSDNSSVWLVVWGKNTIHGIFPKGSKAGLGHEDFGEVTISDPAAASTFGAARLRAYQERWTWDAGLAVKDWRYAVRICNLDISNLVAKSSAADLPELMIKAIHRVPSVRAGKAAFYMNRTCREMLDIQLRDDVQTGGQLSYETVDGKPVTKFRGIPVRICDQLLETEATVS